MKRKIIKIDEALCNGCGMCVPNCAEGALQIIDGKARLISDLFCDGLGACLGNCPLGAIEVEEREAEPYDEKKVMEHVVKGGENVIKAHLKHMLDHGETEYYNQGIQYLKDNKIQIQTEEPKEKIKMHGGCPGSRTVDFSNNSENDKEKSVGNISSELQQWPIQLHLKSPMASYFKGADLLIAADCTAFAMGNFHQDYLKGKKLVIACPKLDANKEVYLDKITALINDSKVNTITVLMMEVPCCGGLIAMVMEALRNASRKVPVKSIVVGLRGEVVSEDWV